MLIIPSDQVQAIYDAQPLRQSPPQSVDQTVQASRSIEYLVLQEDDGETD